MTESTPLLDLDLQVENVKGNVFLTKAQNVIKYDDITEEYISYTVELWVYSLSNQELVSDDDFCVLSVPRRFTDFEVLYHKLVNILSNNVFIIPKLPAKIITRSIDGILQRMDDLQAFINTVFHHPVLRNLKITNDFLTFGAVKQVVKHYSISREITLDSRINAPDNEWFHDQEERLPVSGFIHEYFKSLNDLDRIGEKLKVKEHLYHGMGKDIMIMDKSLKGFGKSVKLFGDQLCNLENSDLNVYKGMPLKRIGRRLRRIEDLLQKKSGSFPTLFKSIESLAKIVPNARPLITNLNQDPVIFQIIHSSLYFFDESLNLTMAKSLKVWADDSVDIFQDITIQFKEIQDILRKNLESPFFSC